MIRRTPGAYVLCALVLLGGCQTYEPMPLDPTQTVEGVDRERRDGGRLAANEAVTFAQTAEWMRTYSPAIKEASAAYATALGLADVPTPMPNIGLQVGPNYGFGKGVTSMPLAPFGSLGIKIPLSGRLALNDALNKHRAEVARIDGISRHRELYLELRRFWSRLATARAILDTRRRQVSAAQDSVRTSRQLVEAGRTTALDVAIFELELGKTRVARLKAEASAANAQAALATLVGIRADRFDVADFGSLPTTIAHVPELEMLKGILIDNHTDLARLRARYEAAEASLRLEIAKQYPDLKIGPSISGEPGERRTTVGLSLGINLPIFDRNQQAIAQAEKRREEIRVRFEAAANRALAELERAFLATKNTATLSQTLKNSILPQAQNSVELARATLDAGSGDVSRLLDAERSYRELLVESQQAALLRTEAWVNLERAVGFPLTGLDPELKNIGFSVPEQLKHQAQQPESEEERVK